MMNTSKLALLLAGLLAIAIALVACGSAGVESGDSDFYAAAPAMQQAPAPAAPAAQMAAEAAPTSRRAMPAQPAAAAPAAAPTAAPAAASQRLEKVVLKEVEAQSEEGLQAGEFSEERAALVAQNRIIVRTVNIELEVDDVVESIEEIAQGAQTDGGWVVSTDRSSKHIGFISVRVPAAKLDNTLEWMRAVGVDVMSEASTSTDVTDEYYDLRSRVESMQATEEALIRLLDRAEKVEDALEVQRELARLQVEIEAHLGRIKLLEETAAFSLVHVTLYLAPQDMRVDAGGDKTFSVGEVARFRATFYPPEGIDEFDFTWDFGDGSQVAWGTVTAPRADGGRITATVHHQYNSDLESPFIVEIKMTGRGDAGIVEGSDTFIATVTELPAIAVFAGEHMVVDEEEEVEFSGSFTRPEGLTNYQYTWEFSDGTPAVTGTPEEGATTVTTTHVYDNHRPQSYTATLTVSAESDAGSVEGRNSIEVFVQETQGFIIAGWSAGDNLKSAVRALSGLAQAAGTVAIWAVIFTPVWIVLGLVIYLIVRSRRRLGLEHRRRTGSESGVDEGYLSTGQDSDDEERN
ncbi:MAG: DUF4349 domain-containing protein [Chloroflexi bacterium]|nr:DUF4349 domain-containing protein [Chloroflexota bacterium]